MARLPTGLSSLGVSTTGAYGLDSMSAIGEEIGRQEFMGQQSSDRSRLSSTR